MQNLKTAVEELKKQGITPRVCINLPADNPDVQQAKSLQAELKTLGIIAEFHINLDLAAAGEDAGGTPADPAAAQESFEVMVTGPKLNCQSFNKKDGAGKPVMAIREPRVQIMQGERFRVSATAKVSPKDAGDGNIIATGGIIYHLVTECKSNPNAVGMYVRQMDITRT